MTTQETKQPKQWPINDDYQPCCQYMSLFDEIFISNFFVSVYRKDGMVGYSPGKPFTLNRGDCVYTSQNYDDWYTKQSGSISLGFKYIEEGKRVRVGSWYKPWTWFSKKYRVRRISLAGVNPHLISLVEDPINTDCVIQKPNGGKS